MNTNTKKKTIISIATLRRNTKKNSIEFDKDKEKFLEQELQHQEEEDKACNFPQC
jgi:hypothetical protein